MDELRRIKADDLMALVNKHRAAIVRDVEASGANATLVASWLFFSFCLDTQRQLGTPVETVMRDVVESLLRSPQAASAKIVSPS